MLFRLQFYEEKNAFPRLFVSKPDISRLEFHTVFRFVFYLLFSAKCRFALPAVNPALHLRNSAETTFSIPYVSLLLLTCEGLHVITLLEVVGVAKPNLIVEPNFTLVGEFGERALPPVNLIGVLNRSPSVAEDTAGIPHTVNLGAVLNGAGTESGLPVAEDGEEECKNVLVESHAEIILKVRVEPTETIHLSHQSWIVGTISELLLGVEGGNLETSRWPVGIPRACTNSRLNFIEVLEHSTPVIPRLLVEDLSRDGTEAGTIALPALTGVVALISIPLLLHSTRSLVLTIAAGLGVLIKVIHEAVVARGVGVFENGVLAHSVEVRAVLSLAEFGESVHGVIHAVVVPLLAALGVVLGGIELLLGDLCRGATIGNAPSVHAAKLKTDIPAALKAKQGGGGRLAC